MSTATAPRSAPAEPKTCPNCESDEPWGFASWCPACGFYPALGTIVNVPKDESHVQDLEQPAALSDVFPPWVWALAAGAVGIIGCSVWVRITWAEEAAFRAAWTLAQTAIGLTALIVGQVTAYLYAATLSDRFLPFDMLMKPVEVWKPTFAGLPKGRSRIFIAVWGAVAILAAIFAVGGIDYGALFDAPGKDKKKPPNAVHEIVKHARSEGEGEAESLEDAMNQFAGDAEPDANADDENRTDGVPDGERVDCVIFGYTEDGPDRFGLLLLATMVDARPKFVATLTAESLPAELQASLAVKLKTLRSDIPLVHTAYAAVWVEPLAMIRLAHKGWTRDKRLKNAEFVEALPDVKPKGERGARNEERRTK